MKKQTKELTPEQRAEKNRRARLYYAKNREKIRIKGAEKRKLKPYVPVPKQNVNFADNPDRENILQLIEAERQNAA